MKGFEETGGKSGAGMGNIEVGRMLDSEAMGVLVRQRIGGDNMEMIRGVSGRKEGSEERGGIRRERGANETDMKGKREREGEKGGDERRDVRMRGKRERSFEI